MPLIFAKPWAWLANCASNRGQSLGSSSVFADNGNRFSNPPPTIVKGNDAKLGVGPFAFDGRLGGVGPLQVLLKEGEEGRQIHLVFPAMDVENRLLRTVKSSIHGPNLSQGRSEEHTSELQSLRHL